MAEKFGAPSVTRYLRNLIGADPRIVYSPQISDDATVVNIETGPGILTLDLDNGYSAQLIVNVYKRDE